MTTNEQCLIRVQDAPEIRMTVDSIIKSLFGVCLEHTLLLSVTKKSCLAQNITLAAKGRRGHCLLLNAENDLHQVV